MRETKTKISLRIGNSLLGIIDRYVELTGTDRSEAIRRFCRMGAQNKANMKLQTKFMEKQQDLWNLDTTELINEEKNLIFERDGYKCRKCNSTTNLIVYQIDKNPLNKNVKYQITLCKNCKERVEKYSPQRRVIEDFVDWFYLL